MTHFPNNPKIGPAITSNTRQNKNAPHQGSGASETLLRDLDYRARSKKAGTCSVLPKG